MKISKVSGPKESAAGRKKSKASGADSGFAERVREAQVAEATAPVTDSANVGAVDSVFALQEVPDATDEHARAALRDYGRDVLDRLDELRIGILNGAFSKDRLADLARNLRKNRQNSTDVRLNEIIHEIELRAEVEIAKLARKSM